LRQATGEWREAQLETTASVIDPKGARIFSDGRRDTLTVTGGTLSSIQSDGLIRKLSFPVRDPGFYQVSVAVRDLLSGKAGNATGFFEVPDLSSARAFVSALLLEDASDSDQADRERILFPPYRFSSGAAIRYRCMVTRPRGKRGLTVEARLSQGERVVRELPGRVLDADDPSLVSLSQDLDLSGIPTGRYSLVIEAGDPKGTRKPARSSVDFDLSP
jgi:hypothetical protein